MSPSLLAALACAVLLRGSLPAEAQVSSEVLTVREALADVLVSDRHGKPIADLKATDFILTMEDGRRLPVESVTFYDCLVPSASKPAIETLESPRPESRFFMLVSDLSADAASRITPRVREWAGTLQAWDYLAVGRLIRGQIAHTGFTRDRAVAAEALELWADENTGLVRAAEALSALRGFAAFASHIQRRKNVVLLTRGWSGPISGADLAATIAALNSSGIAVYSVGVAEGDFDPTLGFTGRYRRPQRLARGTSGAVWDGNDVGRSLDNVLLANRGYYLLGFIPPTLSHNYQRFTVGVRQAGYRVSALPRQRPQR